MKIEQIYTGCLAQGAYYIESNGEAAIIDPLREVEPYITKAEKDGDGNVIREAVGHVELCVLQEFILRYFNTIKRDDKKWFLSPEMAIWHKLYTVFV